MFEQIWINLSLAWVSLATKWRTFRLNSALRGNRLPEAWHEQTALMRCSQRYMSLILRGWPEDEEEATELWSRGIGNALLESLNRDNGEMLRQVLEEGGVPFTVDALLGHFSAGTPPEIWPAVEGHLRPIIEMWWRFWMRD